MLEADLRDRLANQLDVLEEGLTLLDVERYIPSSIGTRSFIDILARDRRGRYVLIELKRSDAAAREAIHEINKYVEAVKAHLGARGDELRAIVVSTEWKELLVPFSRFVHDTSISVLGIKIVLANAGSSITAENVSPLPVTSGRVLSPWHEINLYTSEARLAAGITSYDASCAKKGISDYIMVILKAPPDLYEWSVRATAVNLHAIRGNVGEVPESDVQEVRRKLKRMDHGIYFVPRLLSADEYLAVIKTDRATFDEVKEFYDDLEGEELLASLQEYALAAKPKVKFDHYEIGYPAKFRSRLLETEGWVIKKILRRGAFSRNEVLTDETIIGEIAGEAGTSGQRLKRAILLSDKAEFAQLQQDVTECLINNPVWAGTIRQQLLEAQAEFAKATAHISIFSPSTGALTLFLSATKEDGVLFIPTYSIMIFADGVPQRMYAGELSSLSDSPASPDAFTDMLDKYYEGDIGLLVLTMNWGGYEHRDVDILEDLGLFYDTFRCDIEEDRRLFSRMKNGRWREADAVAMFGNYRSYLENNDRLLRILVHKLNPRIGPVMCDGSSAVRMLEEHIEPATVTRAEYYIDPPEACDICWVPLHREMLMSDCQIGGHDAWANMCADCTVFYGEGIGWGVGQLYRKEPDGQWLLVGGASPYAEDEES